MTVLASLAVILLIQRLLMPKYSGKVVEGAFTGSYYEHPAGHDLLILGDCEAYENISPVVLWNGYGISSYIRGNAQQLIPQSYYLLKETLKYEKPQAVILSISAMQQIGQISEAYNRMVFDDMRWSGIKWEAIRATMLPDEHMIEYLFPILRFHSRFAELEADDLTYLFQRPAVSFAGYYLRADVRPLGDLPSERRRGDYRFEEKGYEYLDRIRELCTEQGISLILMKAPSLYPAWHEEWDEQIRRYADDYGLRYVNCIELSDEIGIDYETDTYDGGLHMNVYGAEKMAGFLGQLLRSETGLTDRRGESPELDAYWEEITNAYNTEKIAQKEEFLENGFLSRYQ